MTNEEKLAKIEKIFQSGQSNKNVLKGEDIEKIYDNLHSIIKTSPELSDRALSTFAGAVKHPENDRTSLESAYEILGDILQKKPELADKTLSIFVDALNHSKNDGSVRAEALKILSSITRNNRELGRKTYEAFKSLKPVKPVIPQAGEIQDCTKIDAPKFNSSKLNVAHHEEVCVPQAETEKQVSPLKPVFIKGIQR